MEIKDKQHNNINIEPFINKINAYVFKFMDKSITGRLVEQNGNYITVELKSGSVIIAHLDSLVSIWNVRSKPVVI
jgi:hypothetical protein